MNVSKAMQRAAIMSFTMAFAFAASAADCDDGFCPLPVRGEATYTVLAPVPESAVAPMKPAPREVTVRHVAVNGVMAGCPPEFMPLLLAFVEAMKNGDFRRTLASTHAWTPYCWLNGPVARQLGFDCGQGEINEPKNAQLGRFINLAMLNLGGYRVKENRMGTFGYLMPWCLVENEAAALNVGWKPYHMQRGYAIDDSTLTAASSINWGNNLVPATSNGAAPDADIIPAANKYRNYIAETQSESADSQGFEKSNKQGNSLHFILCASAMKT